MFTSLYCIAIVNVCFVLWWMDAIFFFCRQLVWLICGRRRALWVTNAHILLPTASCGAHDRIHCRSCRRVWRALWSVACSRAHLGEQHSYQAWRKREMNENCGKVSVREEDVCIGYSQCSSSPTYQSHELSTEDQKWHHIHHNTKHTLTIAIQYSEVNMYIVCRVPLVCYKFHFSLSN